MLQFVQCESKKKKIEEGAEQEHNSLVSVARLLFSSFYLYFSTTEFTSLFFFFTSTNGIYALSQSLPLQLLLLFLFILLALLVNERVCYHRCRTGGSCDGGIITLGDF